MPIARSETTAYVPPPPGLMVRAMEAILPSEHLMGDAAAWSVDWRPAASDSYCGRCGMTAGYGSVLPDGCGACQGEKFAWDRVFKLGVYDDPLAEWIKHMKYGRAWPWADWFGLRLAEVLPGECGGIVCSIPLHWTRRFKRRYDQAHLIAAAMARRSRLQVKQLLKRVRRTRPQTELFSTSSRLENVRGAFVLKKPVNLAGKDIWLVDDVKTSGATAHQCARLLRGAGAQTVNLVVVAVADRGDIRLPVASFGTGLATEGLRE